MELLWQELSFGFPESQELERVVIRLIAAAFLGACIGIERQQAGKSAGVRTHMLVTVGTTVFLLACSRFGMNLDGTSRVIQGIITGIGFIGAGTILKLEGEVEVLHGGERVAVLGVKECFGEMALLDSSVRSASIRVRNDVELLVIARDDFQDLLELHPALARGIIRVLTHRLRIANQSVLLEHTK
jgi:putative Mg2+ transporter-C (MgtC) family protein